LSCCRAELARLAGKDETERRKDAAEILLFSANPFALGERLGFGMQRATNGEQDATEADQV
jgi:hypothetical protein